MLEKEWIGEAGINKNMPAEKTMMMEEWRPEKYVETRVVPEGSLSGDKSSEMAAAKMPPAETYGRSRHT